MKCFTSSKIYNFDQDATGKVCPPCWFLEHTAMVHIFHRYPPSEVLCVFIVEIFPF